MPPIAALLITSALIFYFFHLDSKKGERISSIFWVFSIWFMIVGSRALPEWLMVGAVATIETGTDSSPINLMISLVFTVFALFIIKKRQVDIAGMIRQNLPLFIFIAYCLVSCAWSDFPSVSLRRWIRMLIDIIVVIAIISEVDKITAIKKLFGRLAIFAIPLSFVLIKYFLNYGVLWGTSGEGFTWTGVCTHKNSLGMVLEACMLFLVWKLLILKDFKTIIADLLLIFIAVYIMFNPAAKGSSTAQLSLFASIGILICTKLFKSRMQSFATIFYVLIAVYFLFDFGAKIMFKKSILEYITLASGRDMTFTGRTYIWDATLKEAAKSPILGSGFGVFWAGPRLQKLQSYYLVNGITQSHNGYIQTYANLGIIGLALLVILLVTSLNQRISSIKYDYEYNSLAISFLVQCLLGEFFEATIASPMNMRWIVFLIFLINVPMRDENVQKKLGYMD